MTDYDRTWAEVYGDIQERGPVHRHLNRLMRRQLRGLDYHSVLDVGCGPGHNYQLLCAGHRIERYGGVDVSGRALDVARQAIPNGEFQTLDVQRHGPAGIWDLVYCALIFEHLLDDRAALTNLRPSVGKYLVASTIAGDFNRYRRWDERVGHVRNYAAGELEAKLEAAGYVVRSATYWGFPFYSPVARTLQNHSELGIGTYGPVARAVAEISHALFFLNSHRRGDILVVVAERG